MMACSSFAKFYIFTINNGKAPYFSAGMRVIGEAAISSRPCLDKGGA